MVDVATGNLWQEHEAGYKVFAGSIEKPDLEERNYRILRLRNGLKAVLVHDPQADKSAACLRIAIGSLCDPPDMYGAAHFCEHMITKGTQLFPTENDFVSFVKANGGLRNAGTSPSHTHYWFSIGPSSLLEAIPRLAAFFESPLFTPNVVAREINAVDSENKRNLQDDSRRVLQVERSLSAPGHPWLAFGTGNIDSLTSAARKKAIDEKWDSDTILPDGDGGPVGMETRRRLIEWVEQQYCSGRMTLAILGRESLDTLTEITTRLFSSIPNRGYIERPLITDDPWTEDQRRCTIFIKTIKDKYEFKLAFTIPYQSPQYLAKPASFLAHLIAHEGPGSVFSYLKNKGWLLSIFAGPQTWNRGVQAFAIFGRLTLSGYCNYRDVFRTIFSYISLLRTSTSSFPSYFEEHKELSEIFFRSRENSQPHTYVISLTRRLEEDQPAQWLLNADSLYREYSEAAVKVVLGCLLPERVRLTLSAKDHEILVETSQIDWQKERWYGTEYAVQKFGLDMLEKPVAISELQLPPPNRFIPKNLEVNQDGVSTAPTFPTCILETDSLRLWYKRDNRFWVPKGHAYIVLKSPLAEATARHAALTRIVANLVCDSLDEIAYSASLAGLQYSLNYHSEGLSVCVYGYQDKLPLLLRVVLEKINNLRPQVDRLEVFKEKAIRDYGNFPLQKPADHAGYYARYLVHTMQWTPEEKLPEVAGIGVEDVQVHHANLLSRLYVEMLVIGNSTDKEAIALAALVKEQLQYQVLPPTEIPVPKTLVIPMGKSYTYRHLVTDPEEVNCGLVLDFHFGDSADQDLRRKADFLRHLIDEPAFSTLRTKEQLGYIVATSRWTSVGTIVLRFRMQSRKDPVFLEERIEAFLGSFLEQLKAMSDDDFDTRRRGLIVKKLEKAKNLAEEAGDYWSQIRSGYYNFSQDETDAVALESVTKAQMVEIYERHLLQKKPPRRTLTVYMISRRLEVAFPLPDETIEIVDVHAFKGGLDSTPGAAPVAPHTPNIPDSHVGWPPRGKKRRSPSTETTTVRMTTKEDGKEATREPGSNPFPVSRVQKILKADTQLPMVSKEAVFLISVATEKFIERLTQAGQRVAERQSRVIIQEKDICAVVRGVEEFTFLWDVLSEPDDSYPIREPKKTRKAKNTDTSGGIGVFFSKPAAPAVVNSEDVVMNEGGTATANGEPDV